MPQTRCAAHTQAPLLNFLHNSKKRDKRVIPWNSESESAFEKIKNDLANATLLVHPKMNAEIRLVTDASDLGIGAVLEQRSGNCWKPLAFFSRKLTLTERKYSAYDRELTAIYEAIKHFKYFLEGHKFKILTDHKPLTYMFSQKKDKVNKRQERQILFISQFFLYPFVPLTLRRQVYDTYHKPAHPGIKTTDKLISRKFV